jgi:hypothetical protein
MHARQSRAALTLATMDLMKSIPKVTVRDLLWLTAVVALSVLWWMDRQELISLRKQQQQAADQAAVQAELTARQQAVAQQAVAQMRQQLLTGKTTANTDDE